MNASKSNQGSPLRDFIRGARDGPQVIALASAGFLCNKILRIETPKLDEKIETLWKSPTLATYGPLANRAWLPGALSSTAMMINGVGLAGAGVVHMLSGTKFDYVSFAGMAGAEAVGLGFLTVLSLCGRTKITFR